MTNLNVLSSNNAQADAEKLKSSLYQETQSNRQNLMDEIN
jgi:hypothetical protein